MKKIVALFLVGLLSGCAGAMDASRKSVVVGVHSLAAVADVLGPVDQAKTDAAVQKAQAGDPDGAQADLDRWDQQFRKIAASLSLAWDALRALADTCTAIEEGREDKSMLPRLAVALVEALARLSKDLADAGVKVPGL